MAMDLSFLSMGIIAVLIFGALYLYKKDNKKPVEANVFGVLAAIALVFTLAAWGGFLGEVGLQTTAPPTIEIPENAQITAIITGEEPKVIDLLSIMTIDAGSNKRNACEDQVLYFAEGEDPRLSTAYSIDTTTIASGTGSENGSYLKTNTLYKTIFHDTSGPTYYDGVLGAGVWNPSDAIGAVAIKAPSTTDATVTTSVTFGEDGTAPLWKIATIPDVLDETSTDGRINGQTNVSGEAGSTNELCVGTDSTPADDDTVYYNETAGAAIADGSFYIRMTFGAEGSQAYLKSPVICFVNEMGANQCEGNEFTAITAALYTGSGSEVNVPSDLYPAFSNMPSCVEIGGQSTDGVAYIESGKTATYTITFTADHDYTESTDLFYIFQDDLGDYNGKDIRQGMGASTSGKYVTIGFE